MDINGQNKRMLFPDGWSADWSPDGQWIVFVLGAQIYKLPYDGYLADTSAVVPLATEGRNFFPEWSPDGDWVAYRRSISGEPEHIQGIWIVDKEGNNHEQLFSGNSGSPTWNFDTSEISFFRGVINSSGEVLGDKLWSYELETRQLTEIIFLEGDNSNPKFSPDGDKIVFQSDASPEPPHVWVMDSDGDNLTQLTAEFGLMPDWGPIGTQIVFIGPGGVPWIMNADGSNKRKVLESAF